MRSLHVDTGVEETHFPYPDAAWTYFVLPLPRPLYALLCAETTIRGIRAACFLLPHLRV